MKPFDLEKALTGEPVKLRDGSKAYVKYVMPDDYKGVYPLRGFYHFSVGDTNYVDIVWTKEGKNFYSKYASNLDIICMWEEPRPRVQLDLPCPLKEPQEGMWSITSGIVQSSTYTKIKHSEWYEVNKRHLNAGFYFATKEDAQEWLDTIRNARR